MKKLLLAITLIVFIASCGTPTEVEVLKERKDSLKEVYNKISKQMKELDERIAALDSTYEVRKTLVSTIELEPRSFEHYFEVQGVVDADQSIDINVEMPGKIKDVYVKEGQEVSRGQKLMSVDNDEVQGQFNAAKAQYELAKTTFERLEKLWKQNIGSEIDFLSAKANLEASKQTKNSILEVLMKGLVRAPSNGIIDQIFVKKGEVANGMKPVIRLVNTDDAYLIAEISEKYINRIKRGNEAIVNFSLQNKEWYKAELISIGNFINPGNRTFRVKINMLSNEFNMKPNMLAIVRIKDYEIDSTLVLPEKSIMEDGDGKSYVFIENDGLAKKVNIEKGRSYRGETVITSGLKSGDFVIVAGARSLKDGEKINVQN